MQTEYLKSKPICRLEREFFFYLQQRGTVEKTFKTINSNTNKPVSLAYKSPA